MVRADDDPDKRPAQGAAPQVNPGRDAGAAGAEAGATPRTDVRHRVLTVQECDAYFVAEAELEARALSCWFAEDQTTLLPSSTSSMAALAVVLGGYWTVNLAEPESKTRRLVLGNRDE
jgi:hypothetical protein